MCTNIHSNLCAKGAHLSAENCTAWVGNFFRRFCNMFLKVPLPCLGSMVAAVQLYKAPIYSSPFCEGRVGVVQDLVPLPGPHSVLRDPRPVLLRVGHRLPMLRPVPLPRQIKACDSFSLFSLQSHQLYCTRNIHRGASTQL